MAEKRIPARYIGSTVIYLMPGQGPSFHADGSQRDTNAISYDDVLLMPEREILGYTLLHDPQGNSMPKDLGTGKRILPEHVKLDERELGITGYEWHYGRIDFRPLSPDEIQQELARLKPAQAETSPVESSSPTVDQPPDSQEQVTEGV